MSWVNGDHLQLSSNIKVQKMLSKTNEKVIFSDLIVKINRKGKEQHRTIMITNKAVYNLVPNSYGSCKRRVELSKIISVTVSSVTDEFVIHVPEEYDYRYKSSKKECILASLQSQNDSVKEVKSKNATLESIALTKVAARQQSREDILKRQQMLAAEEHDSDNDDRQDAIKNAQNKLDYLMTQDQKIKITDFELLKVLGRGAFGKVMQVKKKSDGKIYAMKILKKGAIVARNQVEHTRAERSILEQLQHPFLMTLRFAFQSNQKLYLVLDYFQGGELFFHLKHERRFSEEIARLYIAEITLAFGHLHSLNVIYRDLKPENILLDDGGHVCLTDFGLAKEVEADLKTHTFCGTPEYLAPEIVQGQGHDKAVDWWSLGILLYELTVGIPPFYSQNVNEMYSKIQSSALRFPQFVSENCKSLITGLLNRDPKKRLGSDKDMEDIKSAAFFQVPDWDWGKVLRKEMVPKFKPKVKSAGDTSNFDVEFLQEPVIDSVVVGNNIEPAGDLFNGFTLESRPGFLS